MVQPIIKDNERILIRFNKIGNHGKEYFCDKLTIDDEYEHEIVKNMRRVTIDELSRNE